MLMCVRETWAKVVVSCIFMFTVNAAIFAETSRRKYEPEPLLYYNTRSEAGFDLNQEDMTKFHIWPTGIIPYYIDDFSFDKVLRDRIRMFLDGVNRLTVLRFMEIPKPPEDDETRWVLFLNRKGLLGCADHPFKHFTNEGVQKVVLGYDCMNSDENLADIVLSLVGVPPQHNAPDRDKYVDIMKENILADKLHLFNKLKDTEWLFHNLTYDFESAGHYGPYKHTSNGKVTVQRKPRDYYVCHTHDPPAPIPTEKGFSSQDILKIAMIYNYILRNHETPVPECSKLFAPGSELVPIQHNKNLDIKPRKKPSQYMGESEKEQISDKEENHNEEVNNDDKTISDDNDRKDIAEVYNESEMEKNDSKNNDSENVETEKEFDSSDKTNDDSINQYNNEDANRPEDDNGEERDYDVISSEGNKNKLNANNELKNDDEDNSKEKIDYDVSKNTKKLNAYESDDNYKKLNNHYSHSNKTESDHDASKSEGKNNNTKKEKNSNEISDKEGKQSSENNEYTENITTYDDIVNTTRFYNRKPLKHRIVNPKKKKLLGQSDYETGDEGKNKYIHEF